MRIAIATNSLLPADKEGGPAHSSFHLARALRLAGANVCVVTTDRNGSQRLAIPLDCWTEREGVPVFYASTRDGAWIRSRTYARAIRDAVERSDACLMSGVFWNHTGLAAAMACRRFRVPYVTFPRGLLSPWALRHKGLKKRLYWTLVAERIVNGSAAIIALAKQELDDVRAVGVTVPTHVIPNGGYVEDLPDAGLAYMTRAGDEDPYVLFLGRIHVKKGLDILVPAFDQVARANSSVSLVIAGTVDAAYQRQFDALVAKCASRDRIRLVGNVSGAEKARWLAGASVFALTSHSEGLPVAVLEALSAGLPVVVTAGCNLPEVAEADAGIIVSPNPDSAAAALQRLLADQALRLRMGGNAAALARAAFSWESVARRVLEVCRAVTRTGSIGDVHQTQVKQDAAPR